MAEPAEFCRRRIVVLPLSSNREWAFERWWAMARRDALLRLHKSLTSRRDELRRRLGVELNDLGNLNPGDAADVAFGAGSEDVTSHLAELEARELRQIERAMAKIKTGTYGVCEGCSAKIPVERLNALPYSISCVKCQREMESSSAW